MKSISLFIENLAGDMATDSYLTSNKFDGVNQAQTSNLFKPNEVVPNYSEPPKANPGNDEKQQPESTTMKKRPVTVDKNVLSGQQAVSKKYRNQGTNQSKSVVDKLYKHKHDDQGTKEGDNLESRLKK